MAYFANVIAAAHITGEIDIPVNRIYIFSAMIAHSKLAILISLPLERPVELFEWVKSWAHP